MRKVDQALGVLGETETQASSLQAGRSPVSPSRGSSFLAFPEEEVAQSHFQLPNCSPTNVSSPS